MSSRRLRDRIKAQEQAGGTDPDELLLVVGPDQVARVKRASELKPADPEYSQAVIGPDGAARLLLPGGATRSVEPPA